MHKRTTERLIAAAALAILIVAAPLLYEPAAHKSTARAAALVTTPSTSPINERDLMNVINQRAARGARERNPITTTTTWTTAPPITTTAKPRSTSTMAQTAPPTTVASLPVPDPGECGIPGPGTKHPAEENRRLAECLFHNESPWKGDARQWQCVEHLWRDHESGFNDEILTPGRADGIPQALPATKMSTAGADWRTNPATQIRWGFGYIKGRYRTPCAAEASWHTHSPGWY